MEHGQLVDLDLISGNLSEFQHVFAKSFALYYEPHYKEALKSYAPALFNYMLELDQMRFKEISDDVKEKNKNVLDFKWYTRKAESWGVQTFKNWKENLTISEKDIITGYTGSKYDPINEYLRKYDGEIIPNIGGDLDKKSKKALEKIENQIKI